MDFHLFGGENLFLFPDSEDALVVFSLYRNQAADSNTQSDEKHGIGKQDAVIKQRDDTAEQKVSGENKQGFSHGFSVGGWIRDIGLVVVMNPIRFAPVYGNADSHKNRRNEKQNQGVR